MKASTSSICGMEKESSCGPVGISIEASTIRMNAMGSGEWNGPMEVHTKESGRTVYSMEWER